MRIVTLIENTECEPNSVCSHELKNEHGLSFYVETPHHKLLMDTGSTEAVWYNADMLGVDLTAVDTVVLSHGHYDHTGGVMSFAEKNSHGHIYVQRTARREYVSVVEGKETYIGMDPAIAKLHQVQWLDGDYTIDEELSIFTGVTGRKFWPGGNRILLRKEKDQLVQDSFDHEQYLSVVLAGKRVLFSGCAHNGILNVLERYQDVYKTEPDLVLSGFHMMKKSRYTEKDRGIILETAKALKKTKAIYYTGHCTSIPGYQLMKEVMGDQLRYMHTGTEIFV